MMARGQAYVTQLGEIRRVPLGDGSVMTINSDTELKVHLARHMRQIELAQGEAWFEVAKDAERPFVVASGNARPRGGHCFLGPQTRRRGGSAGDGRHRRNMVRCRRRPARVVAGERALISERAVVHYQASETASVDRALAWRNGMIDLNGTTLRDAAEEFNRYNQCQIVIADPNVAAEQFDGLFRISDPEGFAEALKTSLGVSVNTSEPNVIRIERGNDMQNKT
jgi:transmembrane sensor